MCRPEIRSFRLGPAGFGHASPPARGGAGGDSVYRHRKHCVGTYRPGHLLPRCRRLGVVLLGVAAPASTQASGRRRRGLDTSHS